MALVLGVFNCVLISKAKKGVRGHDRVPTRPCNNDIPEVILRDAMSTCLYTVVLSLSIQRAGRLLA
eukprot:805996-Prorocentrum_minimum.AAC.1